jgi:hypothetical protein
MYRSYAPTTDDIDNFRWEASARLTDLLRGELDLDSLFDLFDEAAVASVDGDSQSAR